MYTCYAYIAMMKKEDYIALADKYETQSFILKDPISFVRFYNTPKDIEIAAVIASWLAYGRRTVFMPRISYLLWELMKGNPYRYIMSNEWEKYKDDFRSLYRMTSWHNFAMLCEKLHNVYTRFDTLEDAVIKTTTKKKYKYYFQGLCNLLSGESMIPSPDSNSANKRVNMLLRWLVRQNSPVDIGLWKNIPAASLLVPSDTHSLHAAYSFGIIPKVDETKNVCIRVTDFAKTVFPNDPARMDFALYGYGEASK